MNRTLALSAAAMGVGVQAFGLFLPPVMAVRLDPLATTVQDRADDVRSGEVFAVTAVLVICGALAYLDHNATPLLAGAAAAAAMAGVYEWSLKGARS